jgi:hypothetical protein
MMTCESCRLRTEAIASHLQFMVLHVDKLLTVSIAMCNRQRIRLYIREGLFCGVGGNLRRQ